MYTTATHIYRICLLPRELSASLKTKKKKNCNSSISQRTATPAINLASQKIIQLYIFPYFGTPPTRNGLDS